MNIFAKKQIYCNLHNEWGIHLYIQENENVYLSSNRVINYESSIKNEPFVNTIFSQLFYRILSRKTTSLRV